MKTERQMFIGLALFMTPLALVYGIVGHYGSGVEIAGTILLAVLALSFAFIGIYLWRVERDIPDRPSDLEDPDPSLGVGEVGSFPAHTIWPLIAAIGLTTVGFGLIFGLLLMVPGLGLIAMAVIGMARER